MPRSFGSTCQPYITNIYTVFQDSSNNSIDYQNVDKNSGIKISDGAIDLLSLGIDNNRFTDENGTGSVTHIQENDNAKIPPVFYCINRVMQLAKNEPFPNFPEKKYSLNDLVVVIPAHDDELTIGMMVLSSLQYSLKVIVIDDGSNDRTGEIAKLAGAEVIRLPIMQGKSEAIRFGLQRAQIVGNNAVVVIDGNGLYNPYEIPYLATLVLEGEADVVIGSRFLRNPNIVSSYLFTGNHVGFMALSEKAIDTLFQSENNILLAEISSFFMERGYKVAEIPISIRKKPQSSNKVERIIIAMPSLNEEKNLPGIIKEALHFSNTILVVDDGSTDNSAIVAEEAGAIVIKHEFHRGYGAALNTIFSIARTMDADALIILDSDGQHNPSDIKKFIDKLEMGADVVIGSRFLLHNNIIPLYRKVGMKILDLITNIAGVNMVSDSQSGFRGYGRKAISIMSTCGNGMSAGSEILIKISDYNLKVEEVPISVRYDIEDTSSFNPLIHGASVTSNLLTLLNFRKPIIFLGIPAIILILFGILTLFAEVNMNKDITIPLLYLHIFQIILLATGIILCLEAIIYHYYINCKKKTS